MDSMNRSNSGATSCGPGLASGCPWKLKAGASVSSKPWLDPSNNERWVTRRSEEHTSELQSLMRISYAVFCLKTKQKPNTSLRIHQLQPATINNLKSTQP